ncbi:MAG: 3'-5' exonuclease [Prevotellaceae bacterium]|nr:3'-5' exonuclease [Prevotellaceae bacterium]
MELNLTRPIIFFDLETTGIDTAKDRIVEISYIKILPNGNRCSQNMRINPGMHIPEQASAVHGITDEDVKDCPLFKEVAHQIANDFADSDLAGFNSNHFDIPMLVEEFIRAGVDFKLENRRFVDVQNIYHKLERRTLIAAYKYYCGKNLEDAHSALADTTATYEVLKAQLDFYKDENGEPVLKNDVGFLAEYSRMSDNVDLAGRIVYNTDHIPVFNFGKYKEIPVEDVLKRDPGYYGWIMNGDFPANTKQVLTRIRLQTLNR